MPFNPIQDYDKTQRFFQKHLGPSAIVKRSKGYYFVMVNGGLIKGVCSKTLPGLVSVFKQRYPLQDYAIEIKEVHGKRVPVKVYFK